ncbi:TRAP transporter small permease subunit [Pseudaminobacter sp. 19-2017]|uniref:TRAP transporter small permease protein n=1 Tax=Pseudaminobacter soli (ex Zhang et al. 2022) TaxID=2831468 RepID=A0A942I314_9HYPH|nr:TRAP transporter small permease subunit [Pseudaminobacter soli]MBS3650567.1 TRAP transporter small permease subunit [Pseudaminobacter soli]
MKSIGRLLDRLLDAGAILAGVILVAMMLATVVKVALRAFFNHGILGIDQISGTMMVYLTFFGAAWVLRQDGHVSVDIVTSNLRPASRRLVMTTSSLLGAAICFVLTWFGTKGVMLSLHRGIVVAAELEIPRAVNLWVIPLGCFLLGIEFLRRAARFWQGEAVQSDTPRMEA